MFLVDPGMTALALANLVGFSQIFKQLITAWTLLKPQCVHLRMFVLSFRQWRRRIP
jgi:hypothetical protein